MKSTIRNKKLRKNKIGLQKVYIVLVAIFFITIGFSVLSTSLSISGVATVKKKTWDSGELNYNTTYVPSVQTVEDALKHLYKLTGVLKTDATEISYSNSHSPSVKTVYDAIEDVNKYLNEKGSN